MVFYKNQCHLQLYNCEKAAEKLQDGASILSNLFSINLPTQLLSPLGCQRKILWILSVWQLHRWHLPASACSLSRFPGSLGILPVPKGHGYQWDRDISTRPVGISSPGNPQERGKNSQILPQSLLVCGEFAATWDFHTGNCLNEPMLESLAPFPQNLQGTGAALGLSDLIL